MTTVVSSAEIELGVVGGERPRRSSPEKRTPTGSRPRSDTGPPAAPLRVLLIEDEATVARSFKRLLELDGFAVDCAPDGEAGLEMARAGLYHAIILDRVLPKLSGDQVLERLKREGNSTPVVMVTGYPDLDSAFRAGFLRASCYLQKGKITGAELSAAVREAVATGNRPSPAVPSDLSAPSRKPSESFADLAISFGSSQQTDRSELIRVLAGVLIAPDLTLAEFVALAKSIRLLHQKRYLPAGLVRTRISTWLRDASSAVSLGAERAALLEHRRAIAMRRAIMELVTSDEYVSQIAYRLGYSEAANFDHDFKKFFCMPPRAFRSLL